MPKWSLRDVGIVRGDRGYHVWSRWKKRGSDDLERNEYVASKRMAIKMLMREIGAGPKDIPAQLRSKK